jgi:predicted nuclease of predicted toxin-antitoxin system
MIRFAADENFNGNIIRILQTRLPNIDLIRIQDTPLFGAEDQDVLTWCSDENRILLSHDVSTLKDFAYERILGGLPMPGVFLSDQHASPRSIADDLILIATCSTDTDWAGRVWHLPL